MNNENLYFEIIDSLKLTSFDKMNMYHNIKDELSSSSNKDEICANLIAQFDSMINDRIEQLKEKLELKTEGVFSSDFDKKSFRRIT